MTNRRLFLISAALLPLLGLAAQRPSDESLHHAADLRRLDLEQAIQINDLAGHIESLDDARKLVDTVAAQFGKELPSKWATRRIRSNIARAEYQSASDPGALIPEQQIANAWDDFAQKIGAPPETQMNAAEIHYLRDAGYVSSKFFWARGNQTIWTVSSIYAVGPDGKVTNGSRALEAISLVWGLANNTEAEGFRGIHEEVRKGVLLSDRIPHPEKPPVPGSERGMVVARSVVYPIDVAVNRYIKTHGTGAFNHAVETLLNELFSDAAR